MRLMTARATLLLTFVGLALGLLAVACGGGGTDSNAGKGKIITDPARVPTSTPIKEPVTYKIRNDVITTSGGASGVATGGGAATPTPTLYTVKAGDNCGSIARQYNISVEDLLKVNRNVDAGCGNLHVGDSLKIPSASATPTAGAALGTGPTPKPSGKNYTVASGDTCSAIAGSYGVKVADLISLNGLDSNCSLSVGQVLKIP
jgi:LysM repeat protein